MRRLLSTTPAHWMPEPDEKLLRELAVTAMDAARAAGAAFADIRLTAARYVYIQCVSWEDRQPKMLAPNVGYPIRYGIRAIVDGAWGFAASTELTADAIARTARTAVAVARGNKPRHRQALELAPVAKVADGVWTTSVQQDPLSVSIGEQGELGLDALAGVADVKEVKFASTVFHWRRPTTVFATTDGSLIVQRFTLAAPSGNVEASVGPQYTDSARVDVEGLRTGPYGYEALDGRRMVGGMREAVDRAVILARGASQATSVDVGRYDIVFGAAAVSGLLGSTLANALDASLALGYRANDEGTSFAAPPDKMLGSFRVGAPLLTVRADRTRPDGAATVGWDEEGVKPDAYTIVTDGVITDYHTTRQTAPHLGAWYRGRGESVRSHACMRRGGSAEPVCLLPNLTLEAGAGNTTVGDLIAGTKRGLYIEATDGGSSDQQVLNAQFRGAPTMIRAISNGKLGGYVKDVAFQFIAPSFWKSVDALGGASSIKAIAATTDSQALVEPTQPFPFSTFQVVPLRARQVNVLNTGRTA